MEKLYRSKFFKVNLKKNLTLILLFLMIAACNNMESIKDDITLIDVETNINNMKQAKLSQFASDARYIVIETRPDLYITSKPVIDKSGNFMLTKTSGIEPSLVVLDKSGRLLTKFGTAGRGPEEYQQIENLCFGKDNKICFRSLSDLIEFNLDGTFIRKKSKFFLINEQSVLTPWKFVNDSLIFGYIDNASGREEYKAILINKSGEVMKYYKNHNLLKNVGGRIIGGAQINTFNNNLYFKEQHSDTLFSLSNDFTLDPKYVLNLGSLKMPESIRVDFHKYSENINNYFSIGQIFQTKDYLLMGVNFGNNFPARRLTLIDDTISRSPRVNPMYSSTNTTYCLGIYDKETADLYFCEPTSTDNPLFTSGLYNDIDAGPRFYPASIINDSTFFMTVSAKNLINHVASEDFKNNIPQFPEKKKQLENLANGLTELDNDVIMIVSIRRK